MSPRVVETEAKLCGARIDRAFQDDETRTRGAFRTDQKRLFEPPGRAFRVIAPRVR
ncbi:hypothetical protein [Dokdonella sp.]|uniref:hypothetical protein n=1 Tax=Dokdonella sp. TaxID=2291710 RepID=UPI001B0AD4C2|nr:hypothetical protein [Dokdonella sp.]MBO9665017.1 hypothetical protein [Dokdonella sp.]